MTLSTLRDSDGVPFKETTKYQRIQLWIYFYVGRAGLALEKAGNLKDEVQAATIFETYRKLVMNDKDHYRQFWSGITEEDLLKKNEKHLHTGETLKSMWSTVKPETVKYAAAWAQVSGPGGANKSGWSDEATELEVLCLLWNDKEELRMKTYNKSQQSSDAAEIPFDINKATYESEPVRNSSVPAIPDTPSSEGETLEETPKKQSPPRRNSSQVSNHTLKPTRWLPAFGFQTRGCSTSTTAGQRCACSLSLLLH